MASEAPSALVEEVNVAAGEASRGRSCSGKNKGKVPKRIHKAEREKLKREHLNGLFVELANSLELTQPNNGKASILCEATRLLKDLCGQIRFLKKENSSLLSESHYVAVEKNELKEENSVLETQIAKLKNEIEARVAGSKPDLNAPPPDCQQLELTSQFNGDCLGLQQGPTVLVVPIHPDVQAYPMPDTALVANNNSLVSKPHARYPTPADSWPSELLREQSIIGNGFQLSSSNTVICSTGEQSPSNL
ncbi:hypothetical protein SLE2022_290390 [Rubroshorea leprosula]